jgi:hypothetical protein
LKGEFVNAVIGVLIVIIVLSALIRLWSSRGSGKPVTPPGSSAARRTAPESSPGPRPQPIETSAPPIFRVLALGASGSGKTVFLSSMFHELDHRSQRRRYYLDTSAEQRILLSEIYSTVSDTSKPFPLGTRKGDMREFGFDCVAVDDASGARARVLRVSYLDYAGEVLERGQDGGSTALTDLVAAMESADSLLGIIDGYRVWQLLQGIPAGETHFRNTLRPLFGFMARASCPIQFVLTKWDLVRDFGEPQDADDQSRLDRVIEALMNFEHFSSLVNEHSSRQVVRLIPVSAVGHDFARIVDGTVSKREGATVRPYNIEAPFSAVLPDLFKQVEATLDAGALNGLREEGRKALRAHRLDAVAATLARPAVLAAQRLLAAAYGVTFGDRITSAYLQWMVAPLDVTAQELEKQSNTVNRDLAQLQHLRALVMADFDRTVLRLEAALPQSELRGTW